MARTAQTAKWVAATLLAMLVALAMLTGVMAPTAAAHDLDDDWTGTAFATEIQWLIDEGITTGRDSDGDGEPDSFGPYEVLTREAAVTWLYRLDGAYGRCKWAVNAFTDVEPGAAFCREIGWAVKSGITTGRPNGDGTYRFDPTDFASREATITFLWRLAGEPGNSLPGPAFPDVPASHPFYAAIQWAAETGITTGVDGDGDGTPGDSFDPTAPTSREAGAAFVYRYAHL